MRRHTKKLELWDKVKVCQHFHVCVMLCVCVIVELMVDIDPHKGHCMCMKRLGEPFKSCVSISIMFFGGRARAGQDHNACDQGLIGIWIARERGGGGVPSSERLEPLPPSASENFCCGKKFNHVNERLLDQAQAQASYTPLFGGCPRTSTNSSSMPQHAAAPCTQKGTRG